MITTHYFRPLLEGDHYSQEWTCDNCSKKFYLKIPKGVRVPSLANCPHCECDTDGNNFRDEDKAHGSLSEMG